VKVAVFSTMDVVLPQLFIHVKAGGSPIPSLDVQASLAVLLWPVAHLVGVLVLLPSTMFYSIGELSTNL